LSSSTKSTVNVHYLDHVMTVAEERQVEATEDIYAENGMKLIAKGYAINRSMRERLIAHKLIKPLEDCMAVSDGVTGARCADLAEQLIDSHAVLRAMCTSANGVNPVKLLRDSTFAGRLQTLLTVYTEHQAGKLAHAVSVCMLTLNLAQRMLPGDTDALDVLLVAALSHDVGELYIDPIYLQSQASLGPKAWRHIAAHPVIAHGLLKELNGLARPASALILDHHERLDGFGYPHGRRAGEVSEQAQTLAVAEMLAGMLDKGGGMLQQADIAVKLIHGEFSRPMIDAISGLFKACKVADAVADSDTLIGVLTGARALGQRLQCILRVQDNYWPLFERASPPFKVQWHQARARFESILRAWSSTGLDVQPDGAWLQQEPLALQREVAIILKEINWRLGELERELHARVTRHAAGDLPILERYFRDVRQAADDLAALSTSGEGEIRDSP